MHRERDLAADGRHRRPTLRNATLARQRVPAPTLGASAMTMVDASISRFNHHKGRRRGLKDAKTRCRGCSCKTQSRLVEFAAEFCTLFCAGNGKRAQT